MILVSCSYKKNNTPSTAKNEEDKRILKDSIAARVKNCIPPDTSIKTVGVRYFDRDSVFQVQVWIEKYDTILPTYFDCNIPFGLVPIIYSVSNDIVCLLKGYGQNYRIFIICYLEKGKIILKQYETAMFTDLKNERVVYQEYNNPTRIIVENIRTGKKQIFNINSKPIYSHFHEGKIENNKLILFVDSSKIVFQLVQ